MFFSNLSTENLQFLTSQQALADTSYFIKIMTKKYLFTKHQKWIAYGGSYAGALAIWMIEKYPNLIHGVISTSGPVFLKYDFTCNLKTKTI